MAYFLAMGTRGARVALVGGSLVHSTGNGNTARVEMQLRVSGEEFQNSGGSGLVKVGDWLLAGSPGDFDVRYDVSVGSPAGSPINVWLPLSSQQGWSVEATTINTLVDSLGTLRIRDATTLNVLTSASLDMTATQGVPT